MNLNLENLFKEMAKTAGETLQGESGNLGGEVLLILDKNRESIAELVKARSNGDINEEEFNVELQREKAILEAEMFSLEIVSKSAVQKAMNAAMDTLTNAVEMAFISN